MTIFKNTLLIIFINTTLFLCLAHASINDLNKLSAYKVTTQLFINNELIANPIIIVKENQNATLRIYSSNLKSFNILIKKITGTSPSTREIQYDIHYRYNHKNHHLNPKLILTLSQKGKMIYHVNNKHNLEIISTIEKIN